MNAVRDRGAPGDQPFAHGERGYGQRQSLMCPQSAGGVCAFAKTNPL